MGIRVADRLQPSVLALVFKCVLAIVFERVQFAQTEPHFNVNCALMALYWICAGRAFEVTAGDILAAYDHMLHAAEYAQGGDSALKVLRRILDGFPQDLQDPQVKRVLAGKAGSWGIDPAARSMEVGHLTVC